MQVVFFHNRIVLRIICVGLVILFLLYIKGGGTLNINPPSPEDIVDRAINNLDTAYSYRYILRVNSIVDGKKTFLLNIEGIWNRPDRYYIKGETLSNPIEAYILGEEYMVKDPEGKWLYFQGGPSLIKETISFSESPLADLCYLHDPVIVTEKLYSGKKCYILEGVLAAVSNPLWQAFWQDFNCRLWIDKREFRLHQMELHGRSMGSEDNLTVSVEIYEYDGNLKIIPPQLPVDDTLRK